MIFKWRPGVPVIYKKDHGREILLKGESGLFNSIAIIQTEILCYIEALGFFSFFSYCWILLNTCPHTCHAQFLPGCVSVVMVGTLHISVEA